VPARALFHTAPRCVEIRDVPAPIPTSGQAQGSTERVFAFHPHQSYFAARPADRARP
jgi:hypothetical protein